MTTDNNKKKKGVSFAEEAGGTKSFLAGLGGAGAMWGVVEGVTNNDEVMVTDAPPMTE